MNFRQQVVFRAVMKTGSVSRAARALNFSPHAITKTLRQTEEELGIVLFRRLKGRLYPSPAAEALLPKIDRLHNEIDRTGRIIEELQQGYAGRIIVACVPALGDAFMVDAVASFRKRVPAVQIEIEQLPGEQVLEEVLSGRADFGMLNDVAENAYLDATVFCEAEAVCIMPSDHKLASQARISLADLDGLPLITARGATATGSRVRALLRESDRHRDIDIVTNHNWSALRLVRAGAGVAICDPFLMLEANFPELTARPIASVVPFRANVISLRGRPISRIAKSLIEEMFALLPAIVGAAPVPVRLTRPEG
jgi:DNA-binding transcriptional LysR family regulator